MLEQWVGPPQFLSVVFIHATLGWLHAEFLTPTHTHSARCRSQCSLSTKANFFEFCVSLLLSTRSRLLTDWDDAESLVKLNVLSSHFLAPLLIDGAVLAVGRLLV